MKVKNLEQKAVELLENLLKIYSPTGNESAVSVFLKKELESMGFQVEEDDLGNVKAETGTGAPHILLCGHIDTVPGRIKTLHTNGKLYGRGAVDAKGPLATMIMAVNQLKKEKLCKITLAAVVDEEGEGKGIKSLIKQNISPDYAVFGEPSNTNNIIIGYKGSLTLKVLCKTKTGHSAAPWLYHNAIEEAYKLWETIKNIKFEGEVDNSRFYSVTKCLTKIEGGSGYNIVPDQCELKVDTRLPPKLNPEQVFTQIKEKLESVYPKDMEFNISNKGGLSGYETSKDNPLVNAFSVAVRKITGKQTTLLKKTGSSDMNLMAKTYSIPMVAYGPGNSKLDHTPEEHIELEEYLKAIEICVEAIRRLKTLHSKNILS